METLFEKVNKTTSVTVENEDKGLCLIVETVKSKLMLSLFGGHVLSFLNKTDMKERLWLSKKAIFDGKTPIRGGIPICWPWFSAHVSDPSYPSHGFARSQMFTLTSIRETVNNQDIIQTQLTLEPTQLGLYGYDNLQMNIVIVVSDKLEISIVSMNNGDTEVTLTQALHTYLKVEEIESTLIEGVTTDYNDKPSNTSGNKAPYPYLFEGEVDRIHTLKHSGYTQKQTVAVLSTHNAENSVQKPIVSVEQYGHDSTVVWNPGQEKSVQMKDMEDDGYLSMLCIEAANTSIAQIPLILKPNHIHKLTQTIY